jgi:hypothetical protein
VPGAVALTVAVQVAPVSPRPSVTVTVPSFALVVPPGATSGSAAADGAVIRSSPAPTVSVIDVVEMPLFASITLTVNVELPTAVGVPDSTPSLLSVMPGGRLPAFTDQV